MTSKNNRFWFARNKHEPTEFLKALRFTFIFKINYKFMLLKHENLWNSLLTSHIFVWLLVEYTNEWMFIIELEAIISYIFLEKFKVYFSQIKKQTENPHNSFISNLNWRSKLIVNISREFCEIPLMEQKNSVSFFTQQYSLC